MAKLIDYHEINDVFDGPPVVYKFRSWNDGDNNEVNRIITHRTIRMSSPGQLLADYPECILPYDFENVKESDLQEVAIYHAKHDHPNASPDELVRIAANKRRRMKIFDKQNQRETISYYNNLLYECTGIFCTSYDCQSAVAWETLGCMGSNYAVGFNTTALFKVDGVSGSAGYVRYYPAGNPPKLLPWSLSEEERLEKVDLTLRSVPDTYENESEYRFVCSNYCPRTLEPVPFTQEGRHIEIPLHAYKCIILGDSMEKQDREEVIEATKRSLPGIPILATIWDKKLDQFRLDEIE